MHTDEEVMARMEKALARIAELEAERDALASDRRMIVSHATAGETDGRGMSVNEVSARITMLRNRLWNDAKAPAEARADRLASMLKEAEEIMLRVVRDRDEDWVALGRFLARLKAREVEG